ncbi:Predicted secreted protein [Pseudomonas flavescens]|uniref:Predicted secreted protein n=1 Tax=Phytopseudomonas flavescens TaxID=29435 RepID=A0A1G8H2I8_9GAMM|nr:SIMPL domain-containing protein [Pseudomonas flavescens]SDI00875.1 Predicted secreted protein [Pseudomonas flavescens]
MQPLSRLATALALTTTGLLSITAQADEPRYNQVSLSTQVSHEVAHDLMQVTLYTEAQNTDPAALAAEITRTLNAGLTQARDVKGVSVSQGSRNSYPVYGEKGEDISAWRERAEIRLESADFATLSTLTGDLLKTLKMGGMSFSIADATRKKEEDALIKDAVAAFKERAQLTTEALGGKSYKLVSLGLNGGGFARPPMRLQAMKASSFSSDSVAPEVEAGTSQVTLSADGVIEVQM